MTLSGNIKDFFAQIISWIFHPLFVGLYIVLYLLYGEPQYIAGNAYEKDKIVLIFFINAIFFPLFAIFLCKALGFITSLSLNNQKERIIIYSITMIFFFWTFYVFKNKPLMPILLVQIVLGLFLAVVGDFIANIYCKVSMHATGAGGAFAFFAIILFSQDVYFSNIPITIAAMLAGLICTARLIVSDHTNWEVTIGFLIGTISQVTAYWYLN